MLLNEEQMARVDKQRTEITYNKGEIICKQGSFVSYILFIKKGLVKLFLETKPTPTIISVEKNGYFLGLQSITGQGVFHYSVEAIEDTELCLVNIEVFKELILENAKFAAGVLGYINKDMVKLYDRLHSAAHKQIHGRFAEFLLYLKDNIYQENPFTISITKKDMADIISTSSESVSRLFTELKKEKIISEKGKTITVIDEDKLRQISKFG